MKGISSSLKVYQECWPGYQQRPIVAQLSSMLSVHLYCTHCTSVHCQPLPSWPLRTFPRQPASPSLCTLIRSDPFCKIILEITHHAFLNQQCLMCHCHTFNFIGLHIRTHIIPTFLKFLKSLSLVNLLCLCQWPHLHHAGPTKTGDPSWSKPRPHDASSAWSSHCHAETNQWTMWDMQNSHNSHTRCSSETQMIGSPCTKCLVISQSCWA